MAKVIEVRRTKVLELVRHEIVCSVCGKPSGNLVGPQAIKKWEGRDWYCHEHSPRWHNLAPLCACGHRKSHHYGSKSGCKRATVSYVREADSKTVTVLGWKDKMRHRLAYPKYLRRQEKWDPCECKHYVPTDQIEHDKNAEVQL